MRKKRTVGRQSTTGTLALLTRCLVVLRVLQTAHGPVQLRALAERLERSPKQVKRYLAAIEAAGIHLEANQNGDFNGRIQLAAESRRQQPLELIALTRDELLLLYMRMQGIPQIGEKRLVETLFNKIRAGMAGPEMDQKKLSSMLVNFEKGYKSYDTAERRNILAKLLDALYEQRTCQATYRGAGNKESKVFKIEPYRFFAFDGGLYCYCHIPRYSDVRLLAVERIDALKLNEENFDKSRVVENEIERKRSEAFRIMDDEDGPQLYTLRFSKDEAYYVKERIWHPTQRIKDLPDGGVELTFKASGRFEIERWIRGWGNKLTISRRDKRRRTTR